MNLLWKPCIIIIDYIIWIYRFGVLWDIALLHLLRQSRIWSPSNDYYTNRHFQGVLHNLPHRLHSGKMSCFTFLRQLYVSLTICLGQLTWDCGTPCMYMRNQVMTRLRFLPMVGAGATCHVPPTTVGAVPSITRKEVRTHSLPPDPCVYHACQLHPLTCYTSSH